MALRLARVRANNSGHALMKKKPTLSLCSAARKVRMPAIINPMLATLVDDPFSDLLYVDGYDLMQCSVVERKAKLAEILRSSNFIKLSEHVEGEGEAFFREIEKFHLEGMMAKRAASKYVQKRSSDWLKIKTIMRSEVVIGGYTQPRGARSHFGSLVCGLYRGNDLHYVAHVGGGFNERTLASIYKVMQPLKSDESPFVAVPKTNEPVQ